MIVALLLEVSGGRACFDRVFIRRWEVDWRFEETVTRPSGLHFALELVRGEKARVVVFGVWVAAGLRPGEMGIR